KGNRGWLWPIIIGLIAGAAVMYFLNVRIPDDNIGDSKEHTDKTEKGETSLRDENVNVNVSTQITDVVDKISDAVVGITISRQEETFGWKRKQMKREQVLVLFIKKIMTMPILYPIIM